MEKGKREKREKLTIEYLGNKQDISIYFNLNCNLNCSYCYVEHMNESMTYENMLVLLENINKHKTNLNIQILGGEPTLYKHIEYFVNNIDKRHSLNFITNGIKASTLDLKLDQYQSSIMISIHYEYINEEYFQNIKKTILKYKDSTVLISINIPDKEILLEREEEILVFIDRLVQIDPNVKYSTNNIMIDNENLNTPYELFIDKVLKIVPEKSLNILNQQFLINKEEASIVQVSAKYRELNEDRRFKNKAICEMGFMEVYPNLDLKYLCINESICTAKNFRIPDNPKKIICPMRSCNYHCYSNNTKWFI